MRVLATPRKTDAPIALYAGLDAYRAAGGTIEDPLFEDDYVAILDPELMEKLALQKLNAEAAKYADDWKWTAAQTEFGWLDQQNHLFADPDTRAKFTAEEAAALKEAEETIEQAHARLDTFDSDLDAAAREELWDIVTQEQARYAEIERARADRDVYSETVRAHAGVLVALDRDGDLEIHRGLVRAGDAAAYRAARAAERTGDADGTTGRPDSTGAPDVPDPAPTKRNGGWTDTLRNDLRVMRTAVVRRALARNPAVATDLLTFVLARIVGFGRPHTGYEAPILSLRKEYQGVYASDAMKASETMKHLDPVPAVDLGWLAEPDAALAYRAYRALPDEDRAGVLAHAVATLAVPHLGDDHDVSPAHEEAVLDLGIDFPTELAAVGAMPFDADLVWSRMSKALILGAAGDALGDDWTGRHNGLKKKDLVTAAAAAFRPDPARDAEVEAAATRWLPPGFAPAPVTESEAPEAAEDSGEAAATADVPAEVSNGSQEPAGDAVTAAATNDASGTNGAGNGTAEPDGDGALPAFLNS